MNPDSQGGRNGRKPPALRILVLGATGQIGWELVRSLAPLGQVLAPPRAAVDLDRVAGIEAALVSLAPDLVVNAAAWTAVDLAESEAEACWRLNHAVPAVLAAHCARHGIGLVHFSTDYVFDGSGDQPWTETDLAAPLNVYGQAKLAGEAAIAASGCPALVLRTSWIYSRRRSNFLLTMLRLAAAGQPLAVVADQWGAPTPARLVADTVAVLLARAIPPGERRLTRTGLFHLAARGSTSWQGFASEIFRLREQLTGLAAPSIQPIGSADRSAAARRPANSRLAVDRLEATFGVTLPDWHVALQQCLFDSVTN